MNEEPGAHRSPDERADEAAIRAAQDRLAGAAMTVEWLLATHPAVAEIVTTQASCLRAPGCVRCFIVPTPGHEAGVHLAGELDAWLREQLGPNAPSVEFRFVESLPKTRTGKVMRWMLDEDGQPTTT